MFEVLEHMADIGFRASAASLEELFETAAQALVSIVLDPDGILPAESVKLTAVGDSRESLLVNWLNEVLYWLDGERFAMASFKVDELTPSSVAGQAMGEARNPARHPARLIVKGVTYHQLRVENNGEGWRCEVYLDV